MSATEAAKPVAEAPVEESAQGWSAALSFLRLDTHVLYYNVLNILSVQVNQISPRSTLWSPSGPCGLTIQMESRSSPSPSGDRRSELSIHLTP